MARHENQQKRTEVRRKPRRKAPAVAGPVETVSEFLARGGNIETLPAPKGGIGQGAQPAGRGEGWR